MKNTVNNLRIAYRKSATQARERVTTLFINPDGTVSTNRKATIAWDNK